MMVLKNNSFSYKRKLFLLFFLAFSFYTFSQNPINIQIDSVQVLRTKVSEDIFNIESKINNDINNKSSSLSKIIESNSSIYIKNYGVGQLASISIKGFNASQTDILWNDIKLNSPMLGQSDLNIISLGTSNSLHLDEDNAGNISGSINLKSNVEFKKKHHLLISTSIGSFSSSSGSFSYIKSNNKFSNSTLFSYQAAKNDIEYTNPSLSNSKKSIQKNAETGLLNFEEIFSYKINKNNQLNFLAKYHYADRNLPPTIYETNSSENQKDKLALAKIAWKYNKKNFKLNLFTAYIFQEIDFKFSKSTKPAISISNSFQSKLAIEKSWKKRWLYSASLKNEYHTGESLNYSKKQTQNNFIFQNKLIFKANNNLKLSLGFSELLNNKDFSPFLPNANIQYQLKDSPAKIVLGLNYQSKIHYPTLNDLYWTPGGNKDLKAETSQNIKFVFKLKRKIKTINFSNRFEWFNIWAKNYIQWQAENKLYWSPQNIGTVYSRGFSNQFNLKIDFNNKFSLQNSFNYSFTRITKLEEPNQLIYVPYSQWNINTQLKTPWINIGVNQHYTGKRFTSINNELQLDNYYLLDIAFNKDFTFKNKNRLFLAFNLNNITNQTYFTILNRPMAGININFTLKYKFNLKK